MTSPVAASSATKNASAGIESPVDVAGAELGEVADRHRLVAAGDVGERLERDLRGRRRPGPGCSASVVSVTPGGGSTAGRLEPGEVEPDAPSCRSCSSKPRWRRNSMRERAGTRWPGCGGRSCRRPRRVPRSGVKQRASRCPAGGRRRSTSSDAPAGPGTRAGGRRSGRPSRPRPAARRARRGSGGRPGRSRRSSAAPRPRSGPRGCRR